MKLSFSTLPCEGWSVDELIACCKLNGFAGIELKEDVGYAVTLTMSKEELERAAAKFREAGITVTNIGSRVAFNGIGEDEAQKQDMLRATIDVAAIMGARGVRVMSGNFFKRRSELPKLFDAERIVGQLQEACDYAALHQVQIWIETHNEFSTGPVLRDLLRQVRRDNLKILYDIIHPYEYAEAPEETVRLFGKDCVHVHMKDGVPYEDEDMHDWKYTQIGEGKLPIANIVSELEKSGYDGFYSLEWEPKWRAELSELGLDTSDVLSHYSRYMKDLEQNMRKGAEA